MINKLLLASRNLHKIQEFKEILPAGIDLKSLVDFPQISDIEETGDSFQENAFLKASTLHEYTKRLCIADDSGLCVHALHRAPGIYSARYAGNKATDAQNRLKLLNDLLGVEDRRAYFICCIALVGDNTEAYFQGIINGHISNDERGKKGFGYDSIFIPEGQNITFAEMEPMEKNAMSHRSRAFKDLKSYLDLLFKV